jgi:S1-C subfamily serine protease
LTSAKTPLPTTYARVKRSIVAFIQEYVPLWSEQDKPTDFPPIIGTGFVLGSDGLVATNDHVLRAFARVSKPPGTPTSAWGVRAILFHMTAEGQLEIPLEILGAFQIQNFIPGRAYYGPRRPDLAIIHVKARGLPTLQLASQPPTEGELLATAGFPMGTDALVAPGWLHQLTPTLQTGIVGAVLPFPCQNPHAFVLNVMSQGGASGSPVFYPDSGDVAGVLYGGLFDVDLTAKGDLYKKPTNVTYVVPGAVLAKVLEVASTNPQLQPPTDAKTIAERLQTEQVHNVLEKGRAAQIIRVDQEPAAPAKLEPFNREDAESQRD